VFKDKVMRPFQRLLHGGATERPARAPRRTDTGALQARVRNVAFEELRMHLDRLSTTFVAARANPWLAHQRYADLRSEARHIRDNRAKFPNPRARVAAELLCTFVEARSGGMDEQDFEVIEIFLDTIESGMRPGARTDHADLHALLAQVLQRSGVDARASTR
jgi:hypothetical protein